MHIYAYLASIIKFPPKLSCSDAYFCYTFVYFHIILVFLQCVCFYTCVPVVRFLVSGMFESEEEDKEAEEKLQENRLMLQSLTNHIVQVEREQVHALEPCQLLCPGKEKNRLMLQSLTNHIVQVEREQVHV